MCASEVESELTWQQKLVAMCEVDRRLPESLLVAGQIEEWCCHMPGDIGGNGLLSRSSCQGVTREEAVNAMWEKLQTAFAKGLYLRVSLPGGHERRYRWGKFMWVEVR